MYDVIVVGAGSAGCVVASRLSADPRLRVLLLEAGPWDRHPWLGVPAGFAKVFGDPRFNWSYLTEPEPELDGRRIYWPRGRVIGGSSAINAMVYLRGHAQDYDRWAADGNPGWGWADVLPYFKRSERFEGEPSDHHGRDGELWVTPPALRHPASAAFLAAAGQAGAPIRRDLNDGVPDGAGFLHFTIRRGRRCSASGAFLGAAARRRNLRIETDAHVLRLETESGRVSGVAYMQGGRETRAQAREVVLCAGAVNTPQILMLSGFGPAGHLQRRGVDVVRDLPAVGQGLQDHFYVTCAGPTAPAGSLNASLRGRGLVAEALRYALGRRGVLALGASQVSAFLRSRGDRATPDLQLNFTPLSYSVDELGHVRVDRRPGATIGVAHLAPEARGEVRLRTPDPRAPPEIRAGYLSCERDRAAVLAGLRWARRIWAQSALRPFIAGDLEPGPRPQTDEDLLAYARRAGGSLFHPVGTCRMGPSPTDVVDARLRVRGAPGLRIADASIMPRIVSGNTNAPTIMIGEKAADLVAEDLRAGA